MDILRGLVPLLILLTFTQGRGPTEEDIKTLIRLCNEKGKAYCDLNLQCYNPITQKCDVRHVYNGFVPLDKFPPVHEEDQGQYPQVEACCRHIAHKKLSGQTELEYGCEKTFEFLGICRGDKQPINLTTEADVTLVKHSSLPQNDTHVSEDGAVGFYVGLSVLSVALFIVSLRYFNFKRRFQLTATTGSNVPPKEPRTKTTGAPAKNGADDMQPIESPETTPETPLLERTGTPLVEKTAGITKEGSHEVEPGEPAAETPHPVRVDETEATDNLDTIHGTQDQPNLNDRDCRD